MMATNMPEALDEALLRPGPHRPHLQGRLPVARPAGSRTYQGYLDKVQHELTDERDRQARHDHPVRDRRHDQGPGQRGADHRDPRRPRGHHLARRRSRPSSSRTSARPRTSSTSSASATRSPCTRPATPSSPTAPASTWTIDIATIEKGGDYLGMVASIPPEDQFTRWRSRVRGRHPGLARLAGRRADVLRRRQLLRRVRRPGVGHAAGLVHGGLLGHGLHRVVVLHGVTRLEVGIARRRPPGEAQKGEDDQELLAGRSPTGSRTSSASLLDRAEDAPAREPPSGARARARAGDAQDPHRRRRRGRHRGPARARSSTAGRTTRRRSRTSPSGTTPRRSPHTPRTPSPASRCRGSVSSICRWRSRRPPGTATAIRSRWTRRPGTGRWTGPRRASQARRTRRAGRLRRPRRRAQAGGSSSAAIAARRRDLASVDMTRTTPPRISAAATPVRGARVSPRIHHPRTMAITGFTNG